MTVRNGVLEMQLRRLMHLLTILMRTCAKWWKQSAQGAQVKEPLRIRISRFWRMEGVWVSSLRRYLSKRPPKRRSSPRGTQAAGAAMLRRLVQ